MKAYEAVVKGGKIVPSEPLDLPDGTQVQVILRTRGGILDAAPDPFENIEELAIETGVSDLAEEHDHYLYGTPKAGERRGQR